MSEESKM